MIKSTHGSIQPRRHRRSVGLRALAVAFVALLTLAFTATPPLAHEESAGDITLTHPVSRPAAQGQNGVIYLDIINRGATDDRLIAVSTAIAKKAELHRSTMKDGIHRMKKVDGIVVPAGGKVELAPGGYHVMMIELTFMMMAEETFPATFTFEKAGDITTSVSVESQGGGGDNGGHSGH